MPLHIEQSNNGFLSTLCIYLRQIVERQEYKLIINPINQVIEAAEK